MRIAIVAVGKLKSAELRGAVDDYLGRIRHYASCDEIELKDGSEPELVARFAKAVPERAVRIALEVDGTSYDSAGLARFVAEHEQRGSYALAFLIGGAYGLPAQVSKGAQHRLSLSRLTLPHRLARLLLAEALYRSFTIVRGTPYAH